MRIVALVLFIVSMPLGWAVVAAQKAESAGWITLFNGKDLRNWQPAYDWSVEDGAIILKHVTNGQMIDNNYLWTKEKYGDFVLEVDAKSVQGTNSGIFIRTADIYRPVATGIECQIEVTTQGPRAFGNPDTLAPAGTGRITHNRGRVGGFYDLVEPKPIEIKPNDWHHFVITARGPMLSQEIDGIKTAEINLDHYTETGKNPDGSENKFSIPLKYWPRAGYIGFQNHGTPVWFRNIRIKPLSK
jgi:hypothetical protein